MYLIRYKTKPVTSWIHLEAYEDAESASLYAEKLLSSGRACKVEVYKLIQTGKPVVDNIQVNWENHDRT